jgi:Gluconate 2-dehydrogenase subunit 3
MRSFLWLSRRRGLDEEKLEAMSPKTLEALTARIIPTDREPGAKEANCVNFIDKTLVHEDAAALPLYRGGLALDRGDGAASLIPIWDRDV